MSPRLVALICIWVYSIGMALICELIMRVEPKRPDLYGFATLPILTAAVIATPFALLFEYES